MTKSTILNINDIGVVLFEKSKRAKRLNITIKPFKGVRVAVPYNMSFKIAQEYFHDNLSWAKKNVGIIKNIEIEHLSTLNNLPKIDKIKAKTILTKRLEYLSGKYGFKFNKVFIKNQKSLWGSCSHVNNINLNVNLLKLCQELMDYVIIHELVHTKIKNHSKMFWAELDKIVGNAKKLDKKLKKHRLGLM